MEASAADQSNHKNQTTGNAGHGSDSNGKSKANLYAGAVAQRVLHGPSRGRGGSPRRAASVNSKPPSRLSKMSGATEATS
ncbi:unnamed protein product [Urochloa decumbens]|uniref:Uncharacterized protein n=1 Tax=Urochloa decumbens TaxID=240449 RepID=A0ABC9AEU6_9POAL